MIIDEIHNCRTNIYKKSFLPTTKSEWNAFPIDIRNLETLRASNNLLDREKPPPNSLFFLGGGGERKVHVIHTRIHKKCSSLKVPIAITSKPNSYHLKILLWYYGYVMVQFLKVPVNDN